jgi:hypothetical protein
MDEVKTRPLRVEEVHNMRSRCWYNHVTLAGSLLTVAVAVGACERRDAKSPVVSETERGQTTSPSAEQAADQDSALVRAVHAAPAAPAIAVFGESASVVPRLAYKEVSPYQPVKANVDWWAIRPASATGAEGGNELARANESILSGGRYTLVTYPDTKGTAQLDLLRDDLEPPEPGKARVRFFNAAPDSNVDIVAANDVLFDDVGYRDEVGYREVEPTSLQVRKADSERVLSADPVTLEPGRSYTVIIAGDANGSPGPGALDLIVIEDQLAQPAQTE